jgi:hypothetical protein
MMMMKKSSMILGLFTLLVMICLTTPVRAFTASLSPLSLSSSLSTRCSTTYRSSNSSIKAIADPSTAAFMMIAATTTTTSGIPEDSMPAVLAIVVLGVGFYAYNNNDSSSSNEDSSSSSGGGNDNYSASISSVGGKTLKNDISIPYDAAAYLSYGNLLKEHNKKATIGSGFDTYNKLYKERGIAEVTIKALQKKVEMTTKEIMELVESK